MGFPTQGKAAAGEEKEKGALRVRAAEIVL